MDFSLKEGYDFQDHSILYWVNNPGKEAMTSKTISILYCE